MSRVSFKWVFCALFEREGERRAAELSATSCRAWTWTVATFSVRPVALGIGVRGVWVLRAQFVLINGSTSGSSG